MSDLTKEAQDVLDKAWEHINVLGGYVVPGDIEGSGFCYGIDKALEVIEELGGMDPLKRNPRTATFAPRQRSTP